jgi:hypothetical protein
MRRSAGSAEPASRRSRPEPRGLLLATGLLIWLCGQGLAAAQDLEPRRWTYAPIGTNVLGFGYAFTFGDLHLDPALRIEDVDVELHTTVASYNRYFSFLGKTARLDLAVPYQVGDWKGLVNGVKASAHRSGFADPRIRFSLNIVGAPPLEGKEFLKYCEENPTRTTVGVALGVTLPLGEYMDDKLINLGSNRFAFRPQVGILHTQGPWSFELTGSAFLFTDNDDFFNELRYEQDPLYTLQAHVVRTFDSSLWVSAGMAYGWGGQGTVDGDRKDDERSNLLYGVSLGFPIAETQSIRLGYIGQQTLNDSGMDSHSLVLSWALRF